MKENYQKMKMKTTSYFKMMEPYQKEALAVLRDFISINSVLDPKTATKNMPFGQGVERALNFTAILGKQLGFKVDRCDNYITELSYGEGEKVFDIYAHCDVVPVNIKNWTKDPFKLTIEDDNLYGRGTCDDKGPGIACLYAVKALMDNHRLGGYKLRFLFGGNEENDSLGLKHYFEVLKKGYPTLGISPDADYPLIYAEKSIYAYEASYKLNIPEIKNFAWGDALNIVLSEASVELKEEDPNILESLNQYLVKHPDVKATYKDKILFFKGKPSHGSLPWLGINAGLHLLNFLGEYYSINLLKEIYSQYLDGKGLTFDGNFSNQYFDCSSYNVGKFAFDGTTLNLFVNVRFPSDLPINKVLNNLRKHTSAKITSLGGSDGFIADPKSQFVQILLKSYQEETGDTKALPLAIGGGTYARESKNSVAFGAAFTNRDYRMHGDDEYFPLADFNDNLQIYAHAIDQISEYLRNGMIK